MKIQRKNLLDLQNEIQEKLDAAVRDSLPEIAELLASSIDENFILNGRWDGNGNMITITSGGTSKWKPLADSTKEQYKYKGYSTERTLNRTAGGMASSIEVRPVGDNGISMSSNKKYARLQHFGGTFERTVQITEKMRKYFWARYFETEDEKYMGMALTKKTEFKIKVTTPASPFLVIQMHDIEDVGEIIGKKL